MPAKRSQVGAFLIQQGRGFMGTGDAVRAEACLRQALADSPEDPEALHLLGIIALQRRDPERAVALIERAIAHTRSDPHFFNNLGAALSQLGRPEEAERAFRRALRIDPTFANAHSNLGAALASQGRHEQALEAHTRAVRLKPGSAVFRSNLGRAQKTLGLLEQAVDSFGHAIACTPAEPSAHLGLGIVFGLLGRYAEAETSLQQALALQPGSVDALLALGVILVLDGRFDEALAAYDRALSLAPGNAEIHSRKASALLYKGSLREGWREYEWRIPSSAPTDDRAVPHASPIFPQRPSSLMSRDLNGKRILLIRDQGLGDELFFLGFAKLAKQRGAWLAYMGSERLRGLLAGVRELDAVVGPESLPGHIDLVVSVGDLPGLVGIERFADIPAPLALAPSAERVAGLKRRFTALPPGPMLGVTWRAGTPGPRDNQLRQVSPAALAGALAGWPGPVLVLQRNPGPTELVEFARALGRPVQDFSELNSDLEGMLALLSLLDEYVGIGNTNMHLRATLSRISRVLVPQRADWMWGAEGATSPWFPHFRLYRSAVEGRWDSPLDALAAELAANAGPGALVRTSVFTLS